MTLFRRSLLNESKWEAKYSWPSAKQEITLGYNIQHFRVTGFKYSFVNHGQLEMGCLYPQFPALPSPTMFSVLSQSTLTLSSIIHKFLVVSKPYVNHLHSGPVLQLPLFSMYAFMQFCSTLFCFPFCFPFTIILLAITCIVIVLCEMGE